MVNAQVDSRDMVLFQKYAHIFWIPIVPTGRTAVAVCSHCKHYLEQKEFNEDLQQSYSSLSQKKVPLWTFSGVFILAGLMFLLRMSGSYFENRKEERFAAPMVGDIYSVKLDDESYTLWKVDKIIADTLFVLSNEYETNYYTGLRGLMKKGDESYSGEPYPLLKEDLNELRKKGLVLDVERL